jgi:hypothetical protein
MNRRAAIAVSLLSVIFGWAKGTAQGDGEILPISPGVLSDLRKQTEMGRAFLRRYLGGAGPFAPQQIDDTIILWSRSSADDKERSSEVTEQLGCYFGEYLAEKLDLEWALYRDVRGTDFCVVHKSVSVFSFPHSAIFKAVAQGRTNALAEVEVTLRQQIVEALSNPAVERRRVRGGDA